MISLDQNIKEKASKLLNQDSYLPIQQKLQKYETIPEENDIQLGDDFETYNQRQNVNAVPKVIQQDDSNQTIKQITTPFQKPDYLLNKYDKKRFQISPKPDQRIVDLQVKRQEALESIISPLQPTDLGRKEGRKINMSPERFKYNDFISHDHDNYNERLERRHIKDYPDYKSFSIMSQINGQGNNEDEQPIGLRKFEQIHKTKVSPEYIKKILNPENISEEKLELIKKLHSEGIDFRSLYQFRDKLFESSLLKDDKIPLETYKSIQQNLLGDKLRNVDSLLQDQIMFDDQHISILKISDFIDLYTYHPVRLKKDKNKSDDLYFVLNSNQRGAHEHVNTQNFDTKSSITPIKAHTLQLNRTSLEKRLQNIMDLVSAKLMEKFNSLASAFRFFDANLNQLISFNEFYTALDHIGIKISIEDSKKIFDYLDTDANNAVSYNEFCELSEEKRRGIDPFRSNIQQPNNNEKNSRNVIDSTLTEDQSYKPKKLYLSNINVDDLEQMSKFQSLSSLKKRKFNLQRNASNIQPKSLSAMSNYQLNNTVSFGKKSELQSESISDVINQNYLKDYLENKISKQAYLEAQIVNQKTKSQHNKSSELRSISVARILQRGQIEKQIEDLKMNKGSRNNLSFIDIQKSHHKLKKELSLPPIKSALNASYNGQQTIMDRLNSNLSMISRNNNQIDKLSTSINTQVICSYNKQIISSPLTKRTDNENLKTLKRNYNTNQENVLDLIHKMRMQMIDQKDSGIKGAFTEKPTAMTKREKEEILSNYYNAKKQLNSNNNNNI